MLYDLMEGGCFVPITKARVRKFQLLLNPQVSTCSATPHLQFSPVVFVSGLTISIPVLRPNLTKQTLPPAGCLALSSNRQVCFFVPKSPSWSRQRRKPLMTSQSVYENSIFLFPRSTKIREQSAHIIPSLKLTFLPHSLRSSCPQLG